MILVIKNGLVLTMENDKLIKADVVIENNKIKKIEKNYQGKYDQIIDAKNNVVMPGLVNAHTHLGMYDFRNTNDDLKLMDWLNNKIWPIEKKMTETEIAKATENSCLEMIKTGTTCCNDQYFASDKILEKIKIRCLYTRFLMDIDGEGETRFLEFKNLFEKKKSNLVKYSLGLHSLYTCSQPYVKKCLAYAKKHNLPVHMHYMETKEEVELVNDDMIKPLLNHKLVLAHGIHINNLEQFKKTDLSIVHNPVSNLALGCGIADIVKYKKNNINVCIGTDGIGSGFHLNLFKHLTFAYLLPKGIYQDPTVINAFEVLQMATINGAKALGFENLGLIKENYLADIIIVKLLDQPINNPLVALLTNDLEVLTTIVDGKVLMKEKK